MRWPATIAAILLLTTMAGAQSPVPPKVEDYLQKVSAIRTAVYDAAKSESKTPPRAELEQRIATQVLALLKPLDVKQLAPKDATDWAGMYRMAGLNKEAATLEESAYGYLNVQLMFTAGNLIPDLIRRGEDDRAMRLLKHIPSLDAAMVGMIGESVNSALKQADYFKKKPEFAERCLVVIRNQIDLNESPRNGHPSMAEFCYADLSMKILEARYERSPRESVLRDMKSLRARFAKSKSTNAFGQSPSYRVDEFLLRQAAVGKPAPVITVDRTLGKFESLAAEQGKVVVLDFMAHWCGPCKAALPWLRGLQQTYASQGLQVVSITSFYGYYEATKNLKVDAEFDQMKGFVKTYQMDWPVVFDAKQVTHSRYNVGAIPHLVVIDRKGIVRHIQVGAGEAEEAKTSQVIAGLIKE